MRVWYIQPILVTYYVPWQILKNGIVASVRASNNAEVTASKRPHYQAELLRGRFSMIVSPIQRLQETFYRVMNNGPCLYTVPLSEPYVLDGS